MRISKKKVRGKNDDKPIEKVYHYLMNILCFQFRIITVEYFMDKCTIWELNDLIDYVPYCDRGEWEQARLISYIIAQVNSKKRLTQQDICKFPWEKEDEEFVVKEKDIEISNEEIERLKTLAKELGNGKKSSI